MKDRPMKYREWTDDDGQHVEWEPEVRNGWINTTWGLPSPESITIWLNPKTGETHIGVSPPD